MEVIVCDVDILYNGGAEILLKLHRSRFLPLKIGVRDFKLHGTLRCEIRNSPGVGPVQGLCAGYVLFVCGLCATGLLCETDVRLCASYLPNL